MHVVSSVPQSFARTEVDGFRTAWSCGQDVESVGNQQLIMSSHLAVYLVFLVVSLHPVQAVSLAAIPLFAMMSTVLTQILWGGCSSNQLGAEGWSRQAGTASVRPLGSRAGL